MAVLPATGRQLPPSITRFQPLLSSSQLPSSSPSPEPASIEVPDRRQPLCFRLPWLLRAVASHSSIACWNLTAAAPSIKNQRQRGVISASGSRSINADGDDRPPSVFDLSPRSPSRV
ncbi:hypothetical protein Cni_G22239 [Canna indica]|uniref:Uncharacterized protein n=1 Tax=Canna indica TaxID=4628 RepID=A0AAQ3QJE0_9LILI|nr:hypothetical protein Cni_G22239 [Canna indica]